MNKIHIGKNGPTPCNARSKPCQIGGEHFEGDNAMHQAQIFYEKSQHATPKKNNLSSKSKQLAYVLRHNPQSIGAVASNEGFIDVEKILEGLDLKLEQLKEIVIEDDKGRYEFSSGGTAIRAVQGHSIKVDLGLKKIKPPEFLYHGTTEKAYSSIKKNGLKAMSRNSVHLSENLDTARGVAERRKTGDKVILRVHSGRMFSDGYEFTMSANGVFLTDSVPAMYIEKYF